MEFFGNVSQNYFGISIVSHQALPFQKNCHSVDHENKVARFLPELPLFQKEIFFEKLTNLTDV